MRSGRCALRILAFLSYVHSRGSKWLEAYDDFTADVRNTQFMLADSTFLEFFPGKDVTVGCLFLYCDQSWICIRCTNRRQWRLCHVLPLNKGESAGIVEANYSLPKVRPPGKKVTT